MAAIDQQPRRIGRRKIVGARNLAFDIKMVFEFVPHSPVPIIRGRPQRQPIEIEAFCVLAHNDGAFGAADREEWSVAPGRGVFAQAEVAAAESIKVYRRSENLIEISSRLTQC